MSEVSDDVLEYDLYAGRLHNYTTAASRLV